MRQHQGEEIEYADEAEGEVEGEGDDDEEEEDEDLNHEGEFVDYDLPEKITTSWFGGEYASSESSEGISALEWILYPVKADVFFATYFEKRPLHVSLGKSGGSRFAGLLNEEDIFSLIGQNRLKYGLDLDVTIVKGGVRQNFNYNRGSPDVCNAIAETAPVRRRHKKEGCSLRLLHPQRFSNELWRLMYLLECYWGSCVGCNAYLTPPGYQGFAPHFDDIDAFILQVSGKKRWKLYKSISESSVLPRYSSRDFSVEELSEPIFDDVLEPGDMLYLPRGIIHEAKSLKGESSLHLTISVNQRNNYFEFLKTVLCDALDKFAQESIETRKTLPVGYFLEETQRLETHVDHLLQETLTFVDVPAAIGKEFSEFMLNRLPPPPSLRRLQDKTSRHLSEKVNANSRVTMTYPMSAFAEIDVSMDKPSLFVYHCLSNAREVHQTGGDIADETSPSDTIPPQLEVPLDCGYILNAMLSADIIKLDTIDDSKASLSAIELAQALVDANILTLVHD